MKPKFKPYQFVMVAENMPPYMTHFKKGFVGIVKGTYAELNQASKESDFAEYSIYQISNAKVVDCLAWYEEKQLSEIQYDGNAYEMVYEYLKKSI